MGGEGPLEEALEELVVDPFRRSGDPCLDMSGDKRIPGPALGDPRGLPTRDGVDLPDSGVSRQGVLHGSMLMATEHPSVEFTLLEGPKRVDDDEDAGGGGCCCNEEGLH